jgi:hypothetical protein
VLLKYAQNSENELRGNPKFWKRHFFEDPTEATPVRLSTIPQENVLSLDFAIAVKSCLKMDRQWRLPSLQLSARDYTIRKAAGLVEDFSWLSMIVQQERPQPLMQEKLLRPLLPN